MSSQVLQPLESIIASVIQILAYVHKLHDVFTILLLYLLSLKVLK